MSQCGPINPLLKLTNQQQIDRSLYQDRSQQQQHQQQQQQQQRNVQSHIFKQQNLNPQLELEFQQQQQQQQEFSPIIRNGFVSDAQIGPQIGPQNQPKAGLAPPQSAGGAAAWAKDFANLSINSHSPVAQERISGGAGGGAGGGVQRPGDWSSQFVMNFSERKSFRSQQVAAASQSQQMAAASQSHQYATAGSTMGYHSQISQQFQQIPAFMTEHQEAHYYNDQLTQEFDKQLESEFSQLEEQLSKQDLDKNEVDHVTEHHHQHKHNQEFRNAASAISAIMSSSSSEKFKSSGFLQLMQNISSGEVTLNDAETKLVDADGNDVHKKRMSLLEHQSEGKDEHEKMEMGIQKRVTADLPSSLQEAESKLPDPLAGLNPNDLTTPFEAAKKIAELRHEKYTWEDMLADYRNDDDSF